jgi:HPt (histidine-containing phosphotransfer) domain-containing protein
MNIITGALRDRFLTGLERRVGELTAALAANDVETLTRQFHSLAGIGGTYGFPEVTELARRAETLTRQSSFNAVRRIVDALAAVRMRAAA